MDRRKSAVHGDDAVSIVVKIEKMLNRQFDEPFSRIKIVASCSFPEIADFILTPEVNPETSPQSL